MRSRLQWVVSASLICFSATAVLGEVTFVPLDLSPGDTYHVAFTTDGTRNATSGNIADYNAFVQTQAELSGSITENWGVNWSAIGSTSSVDARDNIGVTDAPIYLLAGDRIADNSDDLWDGFIQTAIDTTQFGVAASSPLNQVWTGTNPDGTAGGIFFLGDTSVIVGNHSITAGGWESFSVEASSGLFSMFAVSEQLTVVPEPAACMLLANVGAVFAFRRRRR